MLTLADKTGRGVWEILALVDEGGKGVWTRDEKTARACLTLNLCMLCFKGSACK